MSVDRGSMTVAMTGVMAVLMVTGLAVSALAVLYAVKTRAEIAADSAALAAAVATYPPTAADTPRAAAGDMASRNGARLIRCDCVVDGRLSPRTVLVSVVVVVRLPIFGSVSVGASSRAEFDPTDWLGL